MLKDRCFKSIKEYLNFVERKRKGLTDRNECLKYHFLLKDEKDHKCRSYSWASKKNFLKNGLKIVPKRQRSKLSDNK